jgi:hypothetical protein
MMEAMTHFLFVLGIVFISITFLMIYAGVLLIRFGFFPGIESFWPARHKRIDLTFVASATTALANNLGNCMHMQMARAGNRLYSDKDFVRHTNLSSIYERHNYNDSVIMTISSSSSSLINNKYNSPVNIQHLDSAMGCS